MFGKFVVFDSNSHSKFESKQCIFFLKAQKILCFSVKNLTQASQNAHLSLLPSIWPSSLIFPCCLFVCRPAMVTGDGNHYRPVLTQYHQVPVPIVMIFPSFNLRWAQLCVSLVHNWVLFYIWLVGIKEDKSCKLDCPVSHETILAMPASL